MKINGADPGSGAANCSAITTIVVTGGPGDNTIDLSAVTANDFSALTSITLHGGDGNDTITGTDLADTLNGDAGDDTLIGGKGDDTMNGGPGNDRLVWNNGDNSDTMNGADGTAVNGAPAVVFEGAGPNAASIQAKVDEFRSALGANNGVGGAFAGGRREVNWDGIPAQFLDPFPGNFFLANSPRGIEFSTPGTRMKVSGDPATPSFEFADVTAVIPGVGLPWGPIEFASFSPSKMFAPIDSVVTDIHFRVPGTDTPATVTAFGAVLVDVDLAATTRLLFFDGSGALIHAQDVLTAGVQSEGLSFTGVILPTGKRAARVQLITGSHPVNSPSIDPPPDGVAIDDVIFAEPAAWFTDTVTVNGAALGDIFEIAPNGARVAFTRTNLIPFVLDIDADTLVVNGGDGDDVMTGTVGLSGLIALTLNGGNGNDQLTGGDGADTLNGDAGDDTLIGGKGDDQMNGGPGNDTLIWNNGDNSDVMNGNEDADTVTVNGAAVGDIFEIAPNGARVAFTRTNLIPFVLDIDAEALVVNGGDGGDIVTGTVGLKPLIALTLNGGNDNDQLTGGDGADRLNGDAGDDTLIGGKGDDQMNGGPGNDTLIWNNGDNSDVMNGGDDDDTVIVNGAAVGDIFEIAPNGARVAFTRTNLIPFVLDIDAEALVVNGGDGDDVMTGTVGLSGLIALTLNGGNGNDQLTGGDGADTLNGDAGDDTLIGAKGDDQMNGGPGNDTLIWNNGDNSDVMNGNEDADTVTVNGAAVGDIFEIAPNGARVAFTRTNLIPFVLDIDAEALVVNGGEGEDIFNVQPLPETTLTINGGSEVASSESRGNDAGNGDELWVDAQNRAVAVVADAIQVQGAKIIQYTGIERLEIQNRSYSLYLPLTLSSSY